MKFVFKRFIRRSLSIVLAFAVIMCSLTVSLSAFAQATTSVSFTLDAATNGGTVDGVALKSMQIAVGETYTSNVTVIAPQGQQFIGWSSDKDDYVGELSFTPKDGATYYAIYGHVIYVDGAAADGGDGSKEKPYKGFSKAVIGNINPFKTSTAVNCVVVLNGTVTLGTISDWYKNENQCLYITGLDPTTGIKNTTSITISTFATSTAAQAVFGKGLYIDHITIDGHSGGIYVRQNTKSFVLGKDVVTNVAPVIFGAESTLDSIYAELWVSQISRFEVAKSTATITGDVVVVLNDGYQTDTNNGIMLGGTVGGNASVIINKAVSSKAFRVNTKYVTSVRGAVNYIVNNNQKSKFARIDLNCTAYNTPDTDLPVAGGFYYIDSAEGGKVMPTETAGKFRVEFDEGYNYITVNGVKTELDANGCFTIATASTAVTPTNNDWIKIEYGYEEPVIPDEPDEPETPDEPYEPTLPTTATFTLDAATNGGLVSGAATKTVEVGYGDEYTSNVTVTAPSGLKFIGWSSDKDDFVGELKFTPKDGATYYAIYGHVVYVDASSGKNPSDGGEGTKEKPYKTLSSTGVPLSTFQNTSAVNCVVVVKGAVSLTSISSYNVGLNKRLYITGLDPTTGELNATSITLHQFATGLANTITPNVFKRGLYMDYVTVSDVALNSNSCNYKIYARGTINNIYLGSNVEGKGKLNVGGADHATTNAYVETAAKNLYFIDIMNQKSGVTFSGNSTVVINGGNITHNDLGVQLGGKVTGNSSVVVNGYDSDVLTINTDKIESVGGAINYIFNNNTRFQITNLKINWTFTNNVGAVDTSIPTTGGFYYIDSAAGGKVLPTDVAGKFKVEFDAGYNHIKVNGEKVKLDSDNCFTISKSSAATLVEPTDNDWIKITYYYEPVTYEFSVNSKTQLPNTLVGYPVSWVATSNENFVVNTNNQIVALKEGSGKLNGISLTNSGMVDIQVDVNITAYDATKTNFADNNFKVSTTDTKNLYILSVLSGIVDPSTFKISGKFRLLDEVQVEGGISSGREYKLYCEDIYTLTVEGTFITDSNTLKTGVYNLGATVESDNTNGHKIKFVFRATAITPVGTTIEQGGKLPDSIKVGYRNVTPTNIGVFMVPEILLNDKDVQPTLKSGFNIDSAEVNIENCDFPAANVKIKYLEDMTYDYSDFYATLTGVEVDMRYVRIVCVPYITYTTSYGSVGVIYGESIIRSHDTANGAIHQNEQKTVAEFRDETEQRINDIKNSTSNINPTGSGKRIYVSNTDSRASDNNNGTRESAPIVTLSKLNSLTLPEGSVVYFKRGDVFRGQVICQPGVTYTTYGEGAKPEFYSSLKNYAKSGTWTMVAPNIYRYSEPQTTDVGMLIFDNGDAHGIKAVKKLNKDTYINATTGRTFESYLDLDTHLHFYHDIVDGYLYLYFEGGNPVDVYDSIEFALTKSIFKVIAGDNNVKIDNLVFRYTGSHGVSAGTTNGLTVQNCEFYWIGGGLSSDNLTRFGNGVEIWGGAYNYTVNNCYFYQVYDAGITWQYKNEQPPEEALKYSAENVNLTNNVMEYCNYSIEYFLNAPPNEINYIKNFNISNNLMWYAGYGLCSQRPDKGRDCHIMSWGHVNPSVSNFTIENNLFAIGNSNLVETYSETASSEKPKYSNNTYIQFVGRKLGRTGLATAYDIFDYNVRKVIYEAYGDKNATIRWIEDNY